MKNRKWIWIMAVASVCLGMGAAVEPKKNQDKVSKPPDKKQEHQDVDPKNQVVNSGARGGSVNRQTQKAL